MIEACSVVKKCDLSLTLWRRSDQRYCSLIRFPSAIRAVRGRRHWDGLPGIGVVIPDKRACLFADKHIAIAGTRHSPWSTEQVTSGVSTLFSSPSLSWIAETYSMPDWTYGQVLVSHKMTGYISQYRGKKTLELDPERAMLHFDWTSLIGGLIEIRLAVGIRDEHMLLIIHRPVVNFDHCWLPAGSRWGNGMGRVVGQCVHVIVHCQCIPQACAVHVTWPEQLNAHAQSGLLSRCSPLHWPMDHYTTPQTIVLSRGVSVKIGVTTVISRPPTNIFVRYY